MYGYGFGKTRQLATLVALQEIGMNQGVQISTYINCVKRLVGEFESTKVKFSKSIERCKDDSVTRSSSDFKDVSEIMFD